MHSVQITGRLVRDPELRPVGDETVCVARLAVDRMGRGGTTGYIDVAVWGKPGEACVEHLRKGRLVAFHGRLEYREWDDNGSRRSAIAAVGSIEFLPDGRRDEQQPTAAAA